MPYDQPPMALRNPIFSAGACAKNNSNDWLARLVDLAQRFITSISRCHFSSAFGKRLTRPPPSTSEAKQEERNKLQKQGIGTVKLMSR